MIYRNHFCLTGAGMVIALAVFLGEHRIDATMCSADPDRAAIGNDAEFTFERGDDHLMILLGASPVARFVFRDEKIRRPYFENLKLPSGIQVTRNQPPLEGKDPTDHDTMHPGLWLAFGDVSGSDFWRNKGTIEHVRFTSEPTIIEGHLRFSTECRLLANNGESIGTILNSYMLRPWSRDSEMPPGKHEGPCPGWLVTWHATLIAGDRAIILGDQEEMGFAARVATGINEKNGGRILNSDATRSAKQTWGQPADWCDYSGAIDGKEFGITLMASRSNFRKSWWHNRDYGVFVANPFGRESMKQGERSSISIDPGKSMNLRFGALIHEGKDLDFAKVFRQFEEMQGQ